MMKQEDQLLFFLAFGIALESVIYPESDLFKAYIGMVTVVGRILTCDTQQKRADLVLPTRAAIRRGFCFVLFFFWFFF